MIRTTHAGYVTGQTQERLVSEHDFPAMRRVGRIIAPEVRDAMIYMRDVLRWPYSRIAHHYRVGCSTAYYVMPRNRARKNRRRKS